MSLFVTFMLIGLWHGANWTFVVFGAMHGLYLVLELMTEKFRRRVSQILHLEKIPAIHHTVQTLIVFTFASISFVFFRAESLSKAWWFIKHMFTSFTYDITPSQILETITAPTGKTVFFVVVFSILGMEILQYFQEKKKTLYVFDGTPRSFRYGWYYSLVSIILVFGFFGAQSFIYFQF
jgi:D-alanyl-lipoteichoic acid acyltransferase DltB (MBOAT superfamily)